MQLQDFEFCVSRYNGEKWKVVAPPWLQSNFKPIPKKSVARTNDQYSFRNSSNIIKTIVSQTRLESKWKQHSGVEHKGKKLNSPIPHDKLDFSNGIVPVVKKSSQHNRMLYGEAEDHTMKLFQRMDRQGKGYLSALDLKRGMKLIGLSLTNEQVEQLIVEMDDNGDGKIQPESYRRQYMKVDEIQKL